MRSEDRTKRMGMDDHDEFTTARAALGEWRIKPLRIHSGVLPEQATTIPGPKDQIIFGSSAIMRYATYHRQGGPFDAIVSCTDGKVVLIARIIATGNRMRVEKDPDAEQWKRKLAPPDDAPRA